MGCFGAPLTGAAPAAGWVGRLPGCSEVSPRGVSRMTRKWPVKGGASAAGRDSGSICEAKLYVFFGGHERVYLVVDQPPLFQEGMDAHNGTDITREVSPAGRNRKVLCRP